MKIAWPGWLTLTAALLALSAPTLARGCERGGCQNGYQDWSVTIDSITVTASTVAKTGGFLSYICHASPVSCRWGIVMPDADCRSRAIVPVSLGRAANELLTVNAICQALEPIEGVPGAGRSLMIIGASKEVTNLFGEDVTARIRNANGRFVQHKFSKVGFLSAYVAVHQTLKHLNAPNDQKSHLQAPSTPWSNQPKYQDGGFRQALDKE